MEVMSLNRKIVLIFVLLFFCFLVTKTQALAGASFSLSPSTGVCVPGGTFNLNIILQSDEPASGATAIIKYDPSILEAERPTAGDIFPTLLARSVDSSGGLARLDMGVELGEPDFFTGQGTFGTVKFKVLQVGSAAISFYFTSGSTTDSNVAHAETHQDILISTTGGSYTFQENNTNTSLDPSCATGGEATPTPTPTPITPPVTTPTPTPTTPPGATPTPTTPPGATPTPSAPGGPAGGAPEGGILGPTVFLSLLSLLMVGAGLLLK